MDTIEKLCKEYTDLNEEEIIEIKDAARYLASMASMFNADAFVDCLMDDGSGDSIVVAEAKPIDNESSYKRTVVGLVATKEKEPAVHRSFNLGVPTKFMKATTQEDARVVQTVEPIYHKDRIVGVFIIEQRMEQLISKEKEEDNSKAFDESTCDNILLHEERDNVVDTIEEGMLFVDHNNKVIFRNKAAEDIYRRLGFLNDITGRNYRDICLVKETSTTTNSNVTIQKIKLGNYYFTVKTIYVNRKDVHYIIAITDITHSKLQEKALVLKSVAFKEMHHRIKNNLQTIAALLRLQRDVMDSEVGKEALNNTISRILAIAATHQILVETEVEKVKLNDIVANIKENTLLYYASEDFRLNVECHGGDFDINFEKAIALALILNELMQNSIKYAFPDRDEGKIVLMTLRRRGKETEIVFIDDGCGFDTAKISGQSMGWVIINSMVKEKLNGHIKIKSDSNGTKVKIVF